MSDAEMEEDLKEFQYQQAKIGAARNACKEDCAPGTLQGYSLKNDICECYPPDSSVVPHGHINGL
ncbi:MAG: hypothetical protein KGI08_09100 [Thaumarchaeota archaeon]|nr:hypothetical protein [Nitrososphaerota archaeon]